MYIRNNQNNINYKGLWSNKYTLKTLEKISEHGTSFQAGVSFSLSLGLKPFSILATPNVDRENKEYAISNAICSAPVKLGVVEAVALPIENLVKRIDKNPSKYLKPETVKNLQSGGGASTYNLASLIIKLGAGFLTAAPKSYITIACIPFIMDKLFDMKPPKRNRLQTMCVPEQTVSQKAKKKELAFTGNPSDFFIKGIAKIFDNKRFQDFVITHKDSEQNIAKHIMAASDSVLTATTALAIQGNSHIKEDRKPPLIYNNVITTAFTLTCGYAIDRLAKSKTKNFIEKFSKIHAGNPKLAKYIEGINILRPTMIFAAIHYGILPFISTYYAERIDNLLKK